MQAVVPCLNRNVNPVSFIEHITQFSFIRSKVTALNNKLCNNPKQNKIRGSGIKINSLAQEHFLYSD